MDKVYKRDQVVEIVNAVLDRVHAPEHAVLGRELAGLRDTILQFLNQLSASRPDDISRTHTPSARDELEAVVTATEQATVTIMESCEKILETMKAAPAAVARDVEACAVRIFEACTFQDITGQRIRKVTDNLHQIDAKIVSILAALGGPSAEVPSDGDLQRASTLLNGPALPQQAVTQDEIDMLLAAFDNANA